LAAPFPREQHGCRLPVAGELRARKGARRRITTSAVQFPGGQDVFLLLVAPGCRLATAEAEALIRLRLLMRFTPFDSSSLLTGACSLPVAGNLLLPLLWPSSAGLTHPFKQDFQGIPG